MPHAVLGLGSNLGARRAIFAAAETLLASQPGCRVLARSPLYETPPLGPPQPDYLNAALRVEWAGTLDGLFALTRHIELVLGRERRERWGARSLDIDVLDWSEGPVRTPELEVPHRELCARSFALGPLLDVAPEKSAALAPVLEWLGGRPPLAVPGWLSVTREGDAFLTDPSADACERLSLLVSAVVACAQLTGQARAALPFRGPSAVFDADGRPWLIERVRQALQQGFLVRAAAVLSEQRDVVKGVLLGEHVGARRTLPALRVQLQPLPLGLARARVSLLRDA